MSIKVMSRVWAHSQQKGGELLVMLALADFANDAGECWPSIPVLAQKARLSVRQTQRVLSALEVAGELRRSRSNGGRNRPSRYSITVTENHDKITVTKLQCKNVTGDIYGMQTVTPMSPALNRHRTVNTDTACVKSRSLAKKKKSPQSNHNTDPQFEKAWSLYPKRSGSNPKERARSAWRARIHEGADPLIMIAGIERYAAYVRAVEWEETQYVKQAATFFGPDKHFLDQWTIPKKPTINGFEQERRPEPIERTPVVKWAIN